MKREESSVFLDSGRENIAIARNVIHLSQVWENTSRISPKSVLQVFSLALVIWNSNLTGHPVFLFARFGNSKVNSTLSFKQTRKRLSWEQWGVTGSCCSLLHPQTWRGYLWSLEVLLTWIACSVLLCLFALISLPWLYFIPTSSLPPALELHLVLRLITSLQKPSLENTQIHTHGVWVKFFPSRVQTFILAITTFGWEAPVHVPAPHTHARGTQFLE